MQPPRDCIDFLVSLVAFPYEQGYDTIKRSTCEPDVTPSILCRSRYVPP